MNNQEGLRGNNQRNKAQNCYDKDGYRDRGQGSWKDKNDKSGLYVPSGNHDNSGTSSGKISMEDMMEELLKGVESTNAGVIMIKSDLYSMIQLVDSHSTL